MSKIADYHVWLDELGLTDTPVTRLDYQAMITRKETTMHDTTRLHLG